MFDHNKHRDANQSIFVSSMEGLATTLAIVVTIFGAPWLYAVSADWIHDLTLWTWGREWLDLIDLIWFCALFPIVFFATRASLVTAIMAGTVTVALRYI